MTQNKSSRTKKKVNETLARRYERAWNYLVSELPEWKKVIIIDRVGEELGRADRDVANELAHEVAKLAESNRKIPPPASQHP